MLLQREPGLRMTVLSVGSLAVDASQRLGWTGRQVVKSRGREQAALTLRTAFSQEALYVAILEGGRVFLVGRESVAPIRKALRESRHHHVARDKNLRAVRHRPEPHHLPAGAPLSELDFALVITLQARKLCPQITGLLHLFGECVSHFCTLPVLL